MAEGARGGFKLRTPEGAGQWLRADEAAASDRGPSRRPIYFSLLDLEGVLEVTEPSRFLAAVAAGRCLLGIVKYGSTHGFISTPNLPNDDVILDG